MRDIYAIGDLQGCQTSFEELLARLPQDSDLWLAGDLVNRGPRSLDTLRQVIALGDRVTAVLGNHDLHLLAVAAGVRQAHGSDTIDDILNAPDRDALIDWVRRQPLAHFAHGHLMVHAGVLPQWDAAQVISLARDVQTQLRGPNWQTFLSRMFGNQPDQWHENLNDEDRQRLTINALTRMRFCTVDGRIDFKIKEGADAATDELRPWFDVPGRRTGEVTVVFGHWSALGLLMRERLLGLDTGCVWGGKLTAVKLADTPARRELIQIACAQIRDPFASADDRRRDRIKKADKAAEAEKVEQFEKAGKAEKVDKADKRETSEKAARRKGA
ncbi:symmetrical bis(5'-nucleosyl)-tetraphosphatase [Pandoraea nosoerga]|uniref:Bis(5'-nucleosyl)-tetraphosphatase, symmetrical n=1 Tax=Pandoraea nosoerga TaxID=2508296 RepID=A0A5E4TBQ0_9BURK|nr:symmetrical bis(5'-nucleosyl)-tetraphosphatase [Pandoraea nosoerga]MBN4664246.1 symmetrical bis(5'-nucleosyl)-tetraphosphatase [Pandoraea nosoerga]MBN4675859.1 symmetrical bis(5'-nucleosyl)-tetraphosphatase [Pandoraea nosoerga]MBN4679334.1 symmetrical bis(5'-nucleosyl)-tetraphosphatase [Pandoraea nosoerga]MBN4743669.1 symmetrical bis(5'-nucleosyl)-tetraphosphatase [Pandoraea nosoerga]VVD83509.1 bis(5'-nucleosyl)-tetraphosphatase (symmetrical) [Pandoraea nosoerga]